MTERRRLPNRRSCETFEIRVSEPPIHGDGIAL